MLNTIYKNYLPLLFLIFFNISQAEVASVNGKNISQDLVDFIKSEVKKQGRSINNEMEENIVDRLIDLEVINQAASNSGLLSDPMILAQAELSTKELIYTLYLQKFIVKNPIYDDEVRLKYDQFKIDFNELEYNASHILVKSRNKAKKIIKKLKRDANFAELASKYSIDDETKENGGDLGWFSKDLMVNSFYEGVKKLKEGEFSKKPIQTQFGWHVIVLKKIRPLAVPKWIDKKDDIKTELQKEKLKAHLEKLRAAANISLKN